MAVTVTGVCGGKLDSSTHPVYQPFIYITHVQIVQENSTLRRPWVGTVGTERTIREVREDLEGRV